MGATLHRIDDPRTPLDKARRMELFRFAQAHGVHEIVHEMPAMVMRDILRGKGITNIKVSPRTLGAANGGHAVSQPPATAQDGPTADATSDLARQWQAEQQREQGRAEHIKKKRDINFLRAECNRLGIKMERRDNTKTLTAKVDAKLAELAGGKDALQRRQ